MAAGVSGPDEDDEAWYPSHPEFKNNEQHYLDHWREWARKKGIELKIKDKL